MVRGQHLDSWIRINFKARKCVFFGCVLSSAVTIAFMGIGTPWLDSNIIFETRKDNNSSTSDTRLCNFRTRYQGGHWLRTPKRRGGIGTPDMREGRDGIEIPKQRDGSVVFLKTHKTGSSSVTSIFQRYGYTRNKTFLVPNVGSLINYSCKFQEKMINRTWRNQTRRYDLLVNHARYDRGEMSSVFPNASFITIIRDPVAQFESAFYYFDLPDALAKANDSLEFFMADPVKNFVEVQAKRRYMTHVVRNNMLFDLGMDLADMYRPGVVEEKIKEIDHHFDLVMICEYFDESLILLKRLLGWNIDDMVYLTKGRRADKYRHQMSDEVRGKIRAWNAGDSSLYHHFNKSFWEKVKSYGPSFSADVAELRQKLDNATKSCFNASTSTTKGLERFVALRSDSPAWCKDMSRSDYDFTAVIRNNMKERNVPLYTFEEKYPHRRVKKVVTTKRKSHPVFTNKTSWKGRRPTLHNYGKMFSTRRLWNNTGSKAIIRTI